MISFREIKQMSDFGDGVSQFLLGLFYEHGIATNRDPDAAHRYYGAAAEANFVHAKYALYQMLYPIEEKRDEALAWLKNAAQSGYVLAESELGLYYHQNPHEKNSDELALRWTKSAADKGFAPALLQLSDYYKNGEHVERDLDMAAAYLRQGAEADDPRCAFYLGSLLIKEGVSEEQIAEGLTWVYAAAMHGHPFACRSLAMIYGFGKHGVARNKQLSSIFNKWATDTLPRWLV